MLLSNWLILYISFCELFFSAHSALQTFPHHLSIRTGSKKHHSSISRFYLMAGWFQQPSAGLPALSFFSYTPRPFSWLPDGASKNTALHSSPWTSILDGPSSFNPQLFPWRSLHPDFYSRLLAIDSSWFIHICFASFLSTSFLNSVPSKVLCSLFPSRPLNLQPPPPNLC